MILALRTLSSRLPPSAAAILGVVLLVLVGFGDYETGPEFSFSLFYLVPVLLVTWVAGRTPGMLTSILGALVWLWADQATGRPYSHAALGYWNAGVRLSFFCISAYLLSALRDALRREHALAETDFLTGIANSRSFYRAAEREIARAARYGHPLSIAYIDLDDFKAINDGYGHAKGDELLRSVAEALRTEVRQVDVVGRLAGDEFAVLFPETAAAAAGEVCARIRARLLEVLQPYAPVTGSVGLATFVRPPASADVMVRRADALMYRVKMAGKDAIRQEVFDS